jgi:hypothetical protein
MALRRRLLLRSLSSIAKQASSSASALGTSGNLACAARGAVGGTSVPPPRAVLGQYRARSAGAFEPAPQIAEYGLDSFTAVSAAAKPNSGSLSNRNSRESTSTVDPGAAHAEPRLVQVVALPSLGSPIREALDQAVGDESFNYSKESSSSTCRTEVVL